MPRSRFAAHDPRSRFNQKLNKYPKLAFRVGLLLAIHLWTHKSRHHFYIEFEAVLSLSWIPRKAHWEKENPSHALPLTTNIGNRFVQIDLLINSIGLRYGWVGGKT